MRHVLQMAAFMLALFCTSAAQAGETVAVDTANPPFMYGENGQAAGVYPALLREAFKRMKVELRIEPQPWKRALAGIDAGTEGVGGIYKNAERIKKYDYSEKLFDEATYVYARAPFAFTGVESLKGKRVGVLRGWSYGEDFDKAAKAGEILTEEVGGDAGNFEKLAAGRLDAVIAIKEAAAAVIAAAGYGGKVTALDPPLAVSPTFLAFAKSQGKTAMLEDFNVALAAMRQDGSFDRIVSDAFSAPKP